MAGERGAVGVLALDLFADAGMICITAFISPYRSDRDLVRNMALDGQFIEVYVNAPLVQMWSRVVTPDHHYLHTSEIGLRLHRHAQVAH